jgi:hypothetical protein
MHQQSIHPAVYVQLTPPSPGKSCRFNWSMQHPPGESEESRLSGDVVEVAESRLHAKTRTERRLTLFGARCESSLGEQANVFNLTDRLLYPSFLCPSLGSDASSRYLEWIGHVREPVVPTQPKVSPLHLESFGKWQLRREQSSLAISQHPTPKARLVVTDATVSACVAPFNSG